MRTLASLLRLRGSDAVRETRRINRSGSQYVPGTMDTTVKQLGSTHSVEGTPTAELTERAEKEREADDDRFGAYGSRKEKRKAPHRETKQNKNRGRTYTYSTVFLTLLVA